MFLILISFAGIADAESIRSASGDAYDRDGHLVFRQIHYWYNDEAGEPRGFTLYACPDGRAFARRTSDYGTHPDTPDFALEIAPTGYREGVRSEAAQRIVYVQRRSDRPEQDAPLPSAEYPVIDDGFNAYAASHWDALLSGEDVPIQYLVPSRHRFYHFRIVKVDDDNPGELRLRMQFDFWFGRFLPHVYVTYDRATRHLIRYEGISNIRDAEGDNVHVRIESPLAERRDDVPRAQLDAALATPLDGRCAL
ncbi:MAG TPA: hypothetical protein VFP88_04845 [Rhodanobacteraceae bacterium]|nr:hypothetical protein [Rhodanobacteraceae bacterium]